MDRRIDPPVEEGTLQLADEHPVPAPDTGDRDIGDDVAPGGDEFDRHLVPAGPKLVNHPPCLRPRQRTSPRPDADFRLFHRTSLMLGAYLVAQWSTFQGTSPVFSIVTVSIVTVSIVTVMISPGNDGDMNCGGPCRRQRPATGRQRTTGGDHIVDEQHPHPGNPAAAAAEGIADVGPPLPEREPVLHDRGPGTPQQPSHRKPREPPQPPGDHLRRTRAAHDPTPPVHWHRHDDVRRPGGDCGGVVAVKERGERCRNVIAAGMLRAEHRVPEQTAIPAQHDDPVPVPTPSPT